MTIPDGEAILPGMTVRHDEGLLYLVEDTRTSTEGYEATHELGGLVVNYMQLQQGSFPPGTRWSKDEAGFRAAFTTEQPARPETIAPNNLRLARIDDLEAVAVHMETVYADTYPNDRGITRDMFENNTAFQEEMRTYLEKQLTDPAKKLFIAWKDDRILGTVGIGSGTASPREGKIWGFYVNASVQGGETAQQLWSVLLDEARAVGFDTLTLDVATDSQRAIGFYLKKGFAITGHED